MKIKIDKLHIQLDGVTINGENIKYLIDDLVLDKVCTGNTSSNKERKHPHGSIPTDGVYILVEEESKYVLVLPEEFSSDCEAIGVAVIEGNKSLLVALKDFDRAQLIEEDKIKLDGLFYDSIESAYRDFNGRGNTRMLMEKGSPAAKLCADCCKNSLTYWWLPSVGEFDLMYRNRTAIDKCLKVCGQEMRLDDWYWTSTPFSSCSAWVFYWSSGRTSNLDKDYRYIVRPVSALPDLTI